MKRLFGLFFVGSSLFLLSGCLKHPTHDPEGPGTGAAIFDFATTRDYTLEIDYLTSASIDFSIYDQFPYEMVTDGGVTRRKFIGIEDRKYEAGQDGSWILTGSENGTLEPIYRAVTDARGYSKSVITMPIMVEKETKSVWLYTRFANVLFGLPEVVELQVNGQVISFENTPIGSRSRAASSRAASSRASMSVPAGMKILGEGSTYGWDDLGKPLYMLSEKAHVPTTLFHNLMGEFPNEKSLLKNPTLSAKYLNKSSNIELTEESQINLVFVHDGGDFKSAVGYYWYDSSVNPPTSASDLAQYTKVVAFPNASYSYEGGNLATGDQVHLKYWDGSSWKDKFPANLTVGFFMYPNGFTSTGGIAPDSRLGTAPMYSNYGFGQQQQQSILIKDPDYNKEGDDTDIIILTFEDMPRHVNTGWNDNDFNDVIFLVKVKGGAEDVPEIPVNPDPDPEPDPYDNYIVYKGTLAYEDLWPSRGDYDMNDVVIEYYCTVMRDIKNNVVGMIDSITPRWSGAEFHNAFGYQLGLNYAKYRNDSRFQISVQTNYNASSSGTVDDGRRFGKSLFNVNASGLEQQPASYPDGRASKLVYIVFDDIKDMVPNYNFYRDEAVNGANAGKKPKPSPQYYFRIATKFGDGDPTHDLDFHPSLAEMGTPPYNPFIVVTSSLFGDGTPRPYIRGEEIHLPSKSDPFRYEPTAKAHEADIAQWFSKGDDRSEPDRGYFFISELNFPWAINIPIYNWNFPKEGKKISDDFYGYPKFGAWASSLGTQNTDWYLPENEGTGIGPIEK